MICPRCRADLSWVAQGKNISGNVIATCRVCNTDLKIEFTKKGTIVRIAS